MPKIETYLLNINITSDYQPYNPLQLPNTTIIYTLQLPLTFTSATITARIEVSATNKRHLYPCLLYLLFRLQ